MKTKNKIYKIKKTAILCALLALTLILSAMLYSCDKPDIYTLVDNILQNKSNGLYTFDAYLNIKINKDYLNDAIPSELDFKIAGTVWNNEDDIKKNNFLIDFALITDDDSDIYTNIYKKGDVLYLELNDLSRIILDLLSSTGFIDAPVKTLFDGFVGYDDGSVLCFDLSGFDLKYFDGYIKEIEKIFTVKSNVKYNYRGPAPKLPEYDDTKILYFSDIKNKIDKGLLKLPNYRYKEIYAVIETAEDNNNYIHILATRESGEREILEKVKIDCDLSKIWGNIEALYSEDFIPVRYLFELFGETIDWDADKKQAFISRGDKQMILDGTVINSKTYISLVLIMLRTDYILRYAAVDDYIEFIIARG